MGCSLTTSALRWPLLLLIVLGGLAAWRVFSPTMLDARRPPTAPRPAAVRGELTAEERGTIELFRSASPSVVYITTSSLQRDRVTEPAGHCRGCGRRQLCQKPY